MKEKHKATPVFGIQYVCSCGWRSAMSHGKGARSRAMAELRKHKDAAKTAEIKKEENA